MSQAVAARPPQDLLTWPAEGYTRVPLNVFTDPELYAWEQDLIFRGPTWSFLGLEVEIPAAGDYITTQVGDTPGHRRAQARRQHQRAGEPLRAQGLDHLLSARRASATRAHNFVCPYHNWIYDFDGNLTSVAFEKGIQGKGGMPADFDKSQPQADPPAGRDDHAASSSAPSRTRRRRSGTTSAR